MDNRKEFETELRKILDEVRTNRHQLLTMQNELFKYNVPKGYTQRIISNKVLLEDVNLNTLVMIALVYGQFINNNTNIYRFLNDDIIKNAKSIRKNIEQSRNNIGTIKFSPSIMVVQDKFLGTITIKQIYELMENNILTYDYRTQRNPRYEKKKDGTVRMIPNVNEKSVKEMEKLILDGRLESTVITINVVAGSSEEMDDMYYDSSKMTLSVARGAELTILDGYHRIVASMRSLSKQPDLDFTFGLMVVNYNTRRAQELVSQLNTITPMDKTHLMALKESRLSDYIVKELQLNSELKGKISSTSNVAKVAGHIVSAGILSDTIDEEFKMDNKKDAIEVSNYLTKFFDYLILTYDDAFLRSVEEVRKTSLINANVMFAGYIVLAARMKNEGIHIRELNSILDRIDFSRYNPMWIEKGILDNNHAISNHSKKEVKKFFKQLNIR